MHPQALKFAIGILEDRGLVPKLFQSFHPLRGIDFEGWLGIMHGFRGQSQFSDGEA